MSDDNDEYIDEFQDFDIPEDSENPKYKQNDVNSQDQSDQQINHDESVDRERKSNNSKSPKSQKKDAKLNSSDNEINHDYLQQESNNKEKPKTPKRNIQRKIENQKSLNEDNSHLISISKQKSKSLTYENNKYSHKDIIPIENIDKNEIDKDKYNVNNTLDLDEIAPPRNKTKKGSNIHNNNNNNITDMSKILNNISIDDHKPINGNNHGNGNGKNVYNNEDNKNLFTEYSKPSKPSQIFSKENSTMNQGRYPSKLQVAENYYKEVQNQLQRLKELDERIKTYEIEGNNVKVFDLLNKQNKSLLKDLDKINDILNIVLEASKINKKNYNNPQTVNNPLAKNKKNNTGFNKSTQDNSVNPNENKIVDIYYKEYTRYETRFITVSNPGYNENLEETLNSLNSQVSQYELENRRLKTLQKQSEFVFDNKIKNPVYSTETDNLNNECSSLKVQNEKFLETTQKNKVKIQQNEEKITDLEGWKSKLFIIAKESYGIDEKDFDSIVSKEKTLQELKHHSNKKVEVLTKILQSNTKKYEGDISRNEKKILSLESRKIELIKEIKIKKLISAENANLVQKYYNIYNSNDINDLLDEDNLPIVSVSKIDRKKSGSSHIKKIIRNIQEEIIEDNGEFQETTIEVNKDQTHHSNFGLIGNQELSSQSSNLTNINKLLSEKKDEINQHNSITKLDENKPQEVKNKNNSTIAGEEKKPINNSKPNFNFNFRGIDNKDKETQSVGLHKGEASKISITSNKEVINKDYTEQKSEYVINSNLNKETSKHENKKSTEIKETKANENNIETTSFSTRRKPNKNESDLPLKTDNINQSSKIDNNVKNTKDEEIEEIEEIYVLILINKIGNC